MSLLMLMPASPAAAANGGSNSANADLGAVAFCQVDVPTNHPNDSLGDCIGFQSVNYRDNFDGLVAHICSFLETDYPDVFYSSYDDFDQCVTDRASAFLG
jgi:hypothetical protein